VGGPVLESNLTRRTYLALFMVHALESDKLVHEVPAIVGCKLPSTRAYSAEIIPVRFGTVNPYSCYTQTCNSLASFL